MIRRLLFALIGVYLLASALWLAWGEVVGQSNQVVLLNVACDPTRELWRDLNTEFLQSTAVQDFQTRTGKQVRIRQSHGGSGSQARAVIDGLPADVVTLALWSDTNAISTAGRIDPNWDERLPNRSLPYFSTIVFVVRKGNPKQIYDWGDLARPDVQIITPNPKTSGNGKWSFLALWGSVLNSGGSEDRARAYVADVFHRVPILDTSARGATMTFAHRAKKGDVHLTWENEAKLEEQETNGEVEVVYPKSSIRAEPHVAVVSSVVRRKGSEEIANDYMQFLYTEAAQEIIAKHHFRPTNAAVQARHTHDYPPMKFFSYETIAPSWEAIQKRFFAEGGEFDAMMAARRGE